MVNLPNIDIVFKQLAYTFVERSARGNVILLLKDDTDKKFTLKEYKLVTDVDVDKEKYTATNLQYIKDAMAGGANKVIVVRIDTEKTVSDALALLVNNYKTGWIAYPGGTPADYDTIATWVKQQRTNKKTFKTVIFKPTTPPNHEGIVILDNEKVTFTDARGEISGDNYLPSLAGFLAGANVKRSTTNLTMTNLVSVTGVSDITADSNAGKMVLINDEGIVKIGIGVNSLTIFDTEKTEDFRYIEIIEAQDMIKDDISTTFKTFIGGYKNSLDNQMIFISAVNDYLKTIANEEVLDKNYDNKSGVDVEAQRQAWISAGKKAQDWDDSKVKNMSFKRQMFLAGQVKILFSIADLKFNINMI